MNWRIRVIGELATLAAIAWYDHPATAAFGLLVVIRHWREDAWPRYPQPDWKEP